MHGLSVMLSQCEYIKWLHLSKLEECRCGPKLYVLSQLLHIKLDNFYINTMCYLSAYYSWCAYKGNGFQIGY